MKKQTGEGEHPGVVNIREIEALIGITEAAFGPEAAAILRASTIGDVERAAVEDREAGVAGRLQRRATAVLVSSERRTVRVSLTDPGTDTAILARFQLSEPLEFSCLFSLDPETGKVVKCGAVTTTYLLVAHKPMCSHCHRPESVVFACDEDGHMEDADPLAAGHEAATLDDVLLRFGYTVVDPSLPKM